ncbi:MAG: hypothetical protein R3A51_08530 [Nannocystaceae bacterium]
MEASTQAAAADAAAPDATRRARSDEGPTQGATDDDAPRRRRGSPKLRAYLQRPVGASALVLDHGVIAPEVAFGYPHVYRLGLAIGVLDHLTLGVTAHWLPGQVAPAWTPTVALAFWRGEQLEVGVRYFRHLYPPPPDPSQAEPYPFQRFAHNVLMSVTLNQAWFSVGFDLGWARGREADPYFAYVTEEEARPFFVRDRLAGGLHVRAGNRRVGVIARVTYPFPSLDIAFQVRFGAFELRPRGGWQ